MKIGNVEIKRTYRPTRIICDVVSLAALVVVTVVAGDLFSKIIYFLGFLGRLSILLFPAVGIGLCVLYVIFTFKSLKFKRYKITKQNAQKVYDWWAFSLALAKIPLLLALIEGEFMFRSWAYSGKMTFSVWILLYVILTLIIMRLADHRIKSMTAVKVQESGGSAVKVKVKVVDDDDNKRGGGAR